jgi:aspartate ammonia-lyase
MKTPGTGEEVSVESAINQLQERAHAAITKSRTRKWAVFAIVLMLVVAHAADSAWAQQAAAPPTKATVRVEKDLLDEKEIPANAYYGVQTERTLENFQISGVEINHYPGFIEAWALVKLAAAQANADVGAMKKERLAAIEKACQAVLAGKYHDQFVVD